MRFFNLNIKGPIWKQDMLTIKNFYWLKLISVGLLTCFHIEFTIMHSRHNALCLISNILESHYFLVYEILIDTIVSKNNNDPMPSHLH